MRPPPRALPFLFLLAGLLALCRPLLRATVLDTLDNPTGWAPFADTGATASTSTAAGQEGNALKLTYDLTSGAFAGVDRTLTGRSFTVDGANALRFLYRATGVTNTLEIKFTDTDSTNTATCDKLYHKFLFTPDDTWREVIVPFTDFKIFTDGNGAFDLASVARAGFAVTRDNGTTGSGALYLDDFRLYKDSAFTSLVDGFESADLKNSRAQTISVFTDGTSTASGVYVTSQTVSGSRGYELNYAVAGGSGRYAGLAQPLGGLAAPQGGERLEFWVKGGFGGEPLKIELWYNKDASIQQRSLASYGTITTAFQKFSIPLSDFSGADLKSLTQVKFLFTDGAGTGRIYLDDIAITGTASEDKSVLVLEDFSLDKPQIAYSTNLDSAASGTFDLVKDVSAPGAAEDNRAARLDYVFSPSAGTPYILIERELRPNLLAEPVVRFRFKGDGGNNTLEVKVMDDDGTEYIRKLPSASDTGGEWKTAALPIQDFAFFVKGTDSSLDLKRIKKITLAVSQGEKAPGTITFDQLESTVQTAFDKGNVGAVLQKVSTPNNPFSPNGDGLQDTAKFAYTLGQTARVVLKVYDLRGLEVKAFDMGDQTAGDHVIEWDGLDRDGRLVSNGVYLFKLSAEGVTDGHDAFKQVIGVLR